MNCDGLSCYANSEHREPGCLRKIALVQLIFSTHGLAHLFSGKLLPFVVQPVEGHVRNINVLILEPAPLYLELDLSGGLITVLDTLQRDIQVSENKDRRGPNRHLILPQTPDYHFCVLGCTGAPNPYLGDVSEVGLFFLRSHGLKHGSIG